MEIASLSSTTERRLVRTGQGTLYVTLPANWMRVLKLRPHSAVTLKRMGDKIIINTKPYGRSKPNSVKS